MSSAEETKESRPPKRKRGFYTKTELHQLFESCDDEIASTRELIREATDLCGRMGKSITSHLTTTIQGGAALAASTTAGHSNTDHEIVWTNDYETDRIEELKRNMLTRIRQQQLESKGEERWDKPRIPGERRRRIVRDKDAPEAPPEPPLTGYIVFVGQMTAKIRHDRPNVPHNQTAVVQEISKLWRISLSDEDRDYYNKFAELGRKEYSKMYMEYRATGTFRPSRYYVKLQGVGPWIHCQPEERNSLERELATYETVQFPPRPPELDEAYAQRDRESKRRRKLKLKGLLNPDGTERTEPDLSLARIATQRKKVKWPPPQNTPEDGVSKDK